MPCSSLSALRSLDQAYQFIQEYVGLYIYPVVPAYFPAGTLLGKRSTAAVALKGILYWTIPVSTFIEIPSILTSGALARFILSSTAYDLITFGVLCHCGRG